MVEILLFVLGVCFGSFVNVLVYRTAIRYKIQIPRFKLQKLNIFEDRSFCDFCGRNLSWVENVPIVSWLVQGGKSRCCKKRLSIAYPVVEVVTGCLFVLSWYKVGQFQGLSGQLLVSLVVVTMLVFGAVFDLYYMILPDFSTGILLVCAMVLMGMSAFEGGVIHELIVQNIMAAAGAGGFLWLLYLITKGKGMGMGDVKLAIFMGLFLGWPKIVVAFYVAFIVGAVVGGCLMVFGKLKRKSLIPFGPFLILGVLVSWWWGDVLISNIRFLFSL